MRPHPFSAAHLTEAGAVPWRPAGFAVVLAAGLAIAMMLCLAGPSVAAWPGDPLVNVPLSLAAGEKYDVFAVPDGCGGAIVAWEDERSGSSDIYAQRVDVNGNVLWQTDGMPVCTAAGDQSLYHSSTGTTGFHPVLADGEGGAWIVWQDSRAFALNQRDIYLQRIDADGNVLFQPGGIPMAARPGMEDQPTLCRDGSGGVFVVWQDKTADPVFYDIHGQHVGPDGSLLWNGGVPLPLVVLDWDQDGPSICPDGQGGFYMAWSDSRDDVGDIYAQHVHANGVNAWAVNGLAVCTATDAQRDVDVVSDWAGGVYLAWEDNRTGSGQEDIYLQHLRGDGTAYWPQDGLALCLAAGNQQRPDLVVGAGGALVAWPDDRDVLYAADVYCDRGLKAEYPLVGINRVLFDFGEPAGVVSDTFQVSNVSLGSVEIQGIAVGSPQYGFSVQPSITTGRCRARP